ncbi:hypothetical protein OAN22_02035 [Alphaproteobacteria bacterium]|nr:hypothetical protein [Alphaproteobacteria bacterium]
MKPRNCLYLTTFITLMASQIQAANDKSPPEFGTLIESPVAPKSPKLLELPPQRDGLKRTNNKQAACALRDHLVNKKAEEEETKKVQDGGEDGTAATE